MAEQSSGSAKAAWIPRWGVLPEVMLLPWMACRFRIPPLPRAVVAAAVRRLVLLHRVALARSCGRIQGVNELKKNEQLPFWNRQACPNCDQSICPIGGGMWFSTDFQNQRYVFAKPSPVG